MSNDLFGEERGRLRWGLEEGCRSTEALHRAAEAGLPSETFQDICQRWWDLFASADNWAGAGEVGKIETERCPNSPKGWENWAWALHKQGRTREAYALLAPILKELRLPGAPSGRAAYCLACFCSVLRKKKEAARWFRLALVQAKNRTAFQHITLREPTLKEFWSEVLEAA